MLKREQVEAVVGRPLTNAEWLEAWRLLKSVERHPDADAILDRCIEQGMTIEALIDELTKTLPPSS